MSPVCWPATVSVEGGGVRVRAQALIDDEVSGRIGPEPPMRTQEPALLPRLEGPTRLEFVCAPGTNVGRRRGGSAGRVSDRWGRANLNQWPLPCWVQAEAAPQDTPPTRGPDGTL